MFVLILNIKIAGSNISFNTQHLSGKYYKLRIINKEYRIIIKKHHTTPITYNAEVRYDHDKVNESRI